jgi:uncharacterized protein
VTWLQRWTDALFLHFPVAAEQLRPHVPSEVEIDTFAGQAWLSYVFFRLKLRPAWLPFVPGLSSLVELNVRTYVRRRGQAGICFLRMYADNRLAIWASRWLTPLCYEPAAMIEERLPDSSTRRISCRPLDGAAGVLAVTFSVTGAPQPVQEESLDAWLLERYRLFVRKRDGGLSVAEVKHKPWEAAAVEVCNIEDRMSGSLRLAVDAGARVGHFSPGVVARFGAFRGVQLGEAAMVGTAHPTTVHAALHCGGR